MSTIVIVFAALSSIGIWLWSYSDKLIYARFGQPEPSRVGVVTMGGVYTEAFSGLKDGLEEKGYREGINIIYYVNDTEGDTEAVLPVVRQLEQRRVDLIYSISTPVTTRIREAVSSDLPIVFNIVGDPVGAGFIRDYSSSGTNLTGCSNLSAELSGKRLEMFTQAFPAIERVVTFYNPENAFSGLSIVYTREAARILSIDLVEKEVSDIPGLTAALDGLEDGLYDGIYITPDAMVVSNIDLVLDRARELGLPTMGHVETLAEKGVSLTYGANFYRLGVQCAATVDQIIRGQKPQNIPVRTPEKLDLVVNLTSLSKTDFSVATDVLNMADRIIE